MRFRRGGNLPELLALLSSRPDFPGLPGAGRLRHVIRLAKEGIREYREQLDALESQVLRRAEDRDVCDDERTYVIRDREDEGYRKGRATEVEAIRDDDETRRLSDRQIHHLFERLAIHRRRLNCRGYPYTEDLIEEQERVYPSSRLLSREAVEGAWDDWRDEAARRLFRQTARDVEYERPFDRDRRLRRESRGEEVRDETRRERESRDQDGKKLTRRQFRAIFERLSRERAELDERGYPYVDDVRNLQQQMFRESRAVSREEIEYAFQRWEGRRLFGHLSRSEGEVERDTPAADRRPGGERDQPCPVPVRRGRDEERRILNVFDEIILDRDKRPDNFSTENVPKLTIVNRRLEECGEPGLEDDDALQREWVEYLFVAARARGVRPRKDQGARRKLRPA